MVEAAPRSRLERLQQWLGDATRPIAFIGVLGMLVVSGITVADVALRWLGVPRISAMNEIVAMTFAVAVSACIPAGLAGGVNLRIDIFARWFAGRLAAWLDAFGALLLFAFFAVLAWRLGVHAQSLAARHSTTIIMGWPQAPFMVAAAALLGAGALVQAVVTLNGFVKAIRFDARASPAKASTTAILVVMATAIALLVLVGFAIADFPALSAWTQKNVGPAVAVAFVLMWIFMFGLVPLAAVMGLVGVLGSALFIGFEPSFSAFATEVAGFLTNSQVATLPLFLMMGSFAAVADPSDDVYRLAQVLVGRFRGGLALATIGGCAGFGALTGSSMATAATIGRVALPEMDARGYSPALSTGCCAAGGTLGALVPPGSGPLVVFALLTEASVGQLFIASVGPAIVAIVFYFITVMLYVRLAPRSAPQAEKAQSGDLLAALKRCTAVGVLFFAVMGGLYLGVFTDSESAAVGCFGAFLVALYRGKLRRKAFLSVMVETTATTALIYGLIFGAQVFSFFVGVSALTESAIAWVSSLGWTPIAVMALLLVMYLVLGSLMESFAVMVITVPIVTPLVLKLGYDVVWWGVIMLCVVETGLIHPPFGLNVFVLKSMLPKVPLWTIYKGVLPFVGADLVKLVLLVIFPIITMWLPSTMMR